MVAQAGACEAEQGQAGECEQDEPDKGQPPSESLEGDEPRIALTTRGSAVDRQSNWAHLFIVGIIALAAAVLVASFGLGVAPLIILVGAFWAVMRGR
jgi:hypothetical protein